MVGWGLLFLRSDNIWYGREGAEMPQFHKGEPCQEQQEGKMGNQNRCLVIHVANIFCIFLLKHLSLGEI